jgi:hypothetical protein
MNVSVSCHKGIKGEQQQPQHSQHVGGGGHFLMHDNQFRSRDVTIYDSPSLDGESFLQVSTFLIIRTMFPMSIDLFQVPFFLCIVVVVVDVIRVPHNQLL